MFSTWTRKGLTRRLRKLEIKLAGVHEAVNSLTGMMKSTNAGSIKNREDVVEYCRIIGELNTRIKYVKQDLAAAQLDSAHSVQRLLEE